MSIYILASFCPVFDNILFINGLELADITFQFWLLKVFHNFNSSLVVQQCLLPFVQNFT